MYIYVYMCIHMYYVCTHANWNMLQHIVVTTCCNQFEELRGPPVINQLQSHERFDWWFDAWEHVFSFVDWLYLTVCIHNYMYKCTHITAFITHKYTIIYGYIYIYICLYLYTYTYTIHIHLNIHKMYIRIYYTI